jgi:hypothetical protein
VPASQTFPVAQALPQVPQFAASESVETQSPPQSVWVEGQIGPTSTIAVSGLAEVSGVVEVSGCDVVSGTDALSPMAASEVVLLSTPPPPPPPQAAASVAPQSDTARRASLDSRKIMKPPSRNRARGRAGDRFAVGA